MVGLIRGELRQVKNPQRLVKTIAQYNATYKDWKQLANVSTTHLQLDRLNRGLY